MFCKSSLICLDKTMIRSVVSVDKQHRHCCHWRQVDELGGSQWSGQLIFLILWRTSTSASSCAFACAWWISHIHPWCHTCWPLGRQHGSPHLLFGSFCILRSKLFYSYVVCHHCCYCYYLSTQLCQQISNLRMKHDKNNIMGHPATSGHKTSEDTMPPRYHKNDIETWRHENYTKRHDSNDITSQHPFFFVVCELQVVGGGVWSETAHMFCHWAAEGIRRTGTDCVRLQLQPPLTGETLARIHG